jgi:hypothetical protein
MRGETADCTTGVLMAGEVPRGRRPGPKTPAVAGARRPPRTSQDPSEEAGANLRPGPRTCRVYFLGPPAAAAFAGVAAPDGRGFISFTMWDAPSTSIMFHSM